LKASVEAIADELACAAGWYAATGTHSGVYHSGFRYRGSGKASDLIRPAATDLFR
jgi:hypothetical protein